MRRAAVKCDDGGPAKPVAPRAAPPNAQATPPMNYKRNHDENLHSTVSNHKWNLPRATTAMTARNGGPANHWPQQSFPGRSDGDLKSKREKKSL